MITPVTMYAAKCDCCGCEWKNFDGIIAYPDKCSMEEQLMNDEWETGKEGEKDKHYCPDCWYYDDEDNFCIKTERRKEEKQ